MAVLGAMLLDPDSAIDIAAERLDPSCFFNPAHRLVFETILDLREESGPHNIDALVVEDALRRKGRLDDVGGAVFLARLMNTVPSAANIERYADIVYEHAVLRRMIDVGSSMVRRCFDVEKTPRELLDEFEEEILTIAEVGRSEGAVPVGEIAMDAVDLLEKIRDRDPAVMGLSTGFPDLDAFITGLRKGEMIVLAARPSIGKTALALNIACNVALNPENPAPVAVFSLEMSRELLLLRLVCSMARISLSDIRDGHISQARWIDLIGEVDRLRRTPLFIDDTGGLSIKELRHRARQLRRKHKIELIVVDYLQLIRSDATNRNATRENEVARISAQLKGLAKELQVPVLVLAQLNRQAEQANQLPRLSHLRESGAIEQDADIVMLLHRERDVESARGGEEGHEAKIIVAKHRNGPTGVVTLRFVPKWTRFESVTHHVPEDAVAQFAQE